MRRFLLPLLLFGALVVFLAIGLRLDPKEVPSPLIGKQVPGFQLAQLHEPEKIIAPADMAGRVWLLNIWASWCVSCREEHPHLMGLSSLHAAPIVGLNYKDGRQDGMDWLRQFGNPYSVSAFDHDGRVGIDFGVYGVPETFVIDKLGVIRYKHIGPLTPEVINGKLLPMIKELNRG
ncbi:MAG TPA: DsbE family thiol:disulfide interchange protein [Telluria sp.]|jgi:cytochrome c biogenesis protein CcmG/thiol:disulfide interchange protein DsbE